MPPQTKVLGLTETGVTLPQLSLEALALNTSAGATTTLVSLEFSVRVMFVQTTVGGVVSTTVTVALQLLVLPRPSSTNTVTRVAPNPTNVPGVGAWRKFNGPPQLSLAT